MAGGPVTLTRYPDGVGVVKFDNPPMNALALPVLEGLGACLKAAHADPAVKAIVVAGGGSKFSAGFDISNFKKSQDSAGKGAGALPASNFNDVLNSLVEAGPKPVVAAVETLALGGGLEIALACNGRVATRGAALGLPELSLGVIPGFGGTQRLPRLVGVEKALEMMLKSAPIKAEKAKELGLVDIMVSDAALLMPVAHTLALDIAAGKVSKSMSLTREDKLPPKEALGPIFQFARAQAKKSAPHMPQPHACLDAVEHGLLNGGLAGLRMEGERFEKCVTSDASKGLVHVFFAQRATSSVKGVTDRGLKPRPMKRVAVLGGGLMGSGICTALALAGIDVLLKEIKPEFLDAGMGRIKANLDSSVKKKRMTQEKADKVFSKVKGTLTYDEFKTVDMVIEAALEDIPLKQKIFVDLERACNPNCILATNTSTIDIKLVGAKTSCPERILGAHFFSPAHVMKLLEIVRTDATSAQCLVDTIALSKRIKKIPVVVGNCTGFAVNRVFFPYTMAAMMLVDLGVDPYVIDQAVAKGFGMPMGPLRLSDLVGGDIGVHVGANFIDSFPERVYKSTLLPSMVEQKRMGEKTGAGFYSYDAKRKASPDAAGIAPFLAASRAATPLKGKPVPSTSEMDINEFVMFPVVNEGCRVLAEGIVDKASDLDICCVLGMGFPPFRGGVIKYGDTVGAAYVVKRLEEWAAKYGSFFTPCAYLKQCAAKGVKLEAGVGAGLAGKL